MYQIAFKIGPLTIHWYGVIIALAFLAGELQGADPEAFSKLVLQIVRSGHCYRTAVRPASSKLITNFVTVYRLQLIAELNLIGAHEISMLDAGLAGYHQYCLTTNNLKLHQAQETVPPEKLAKSQAGTHSAALAGLKLFQDTLERLRRKRSQSQIVNITGAQAVAVQMNADGSTGGK